MTFTTNNFLTFHGGVDTVTGSRFLLEAGSSRILIDCGLFQGGRELRERNWADPPFAPKSINAVVLTHAHLVPVHGSVRRSGRGDGIAPAVS